MAQMIMGVIYNFIKEMEGYEMKTSYANRGMALEELLEYTNVSYLNRSMAVVHKRSTPIRITKIHGTKIGGYLEKVSTVDY